MLFLKIETTAHGYVGMAHKQQVKQEEQNTKSSKKSKTPHQLRGAK
jgi:hypothetical protein